jgi:hypothetical protein
MNLFNDLKTDGLEENQDRLGGFSVLETDLYAGKIKMAYAGQAASGARSVTVIVDFSGREYRETVYITNRKGENFFLNKDDKSKKVALPGFTTIDDLCQVATNKPLSEQRAEEKLVQIYNPETKKEEPTATPVLVDLIGSDILVAIQKTTVDKTKKEGDEYVPTGESKDENHIAKVFHPTLRVTVVEAKANQPAGFIDAWVERNKGKTFDKRQNKGDGVKDGRPGANGNTPPQAGANGGQRRSLFGGAAAA